MALMLAILAVFAGVFGYFLHNGIRQTEQRLIDRSSGSAQVVATNAFWIAEVAQQTLRRVDAALDSITPGPGDDLGPVLDSLPGFSEIYAANAEGEILFSTLPGTAGISVADREYFVALRDGARFSTSSKIISRLTGDSVFVFTKRIERDGAFAGAIIVSFPESILAELWRNLDLEEGSTISLVRADGQLMARYPPTDGPVDLSALPLFQELLPASDVGTYVSDSSPVDGIARTVSYRRVAGTDIVALASIASSQVWASFNWAVVSVLIIVTPVILGLVLGCIWIVRLLYRDAAQARALEASLEANTMLFREIHHRVKNNLQSVQSLVRMQDLPQGAKLDLQSRFAAMAAMHQHIYQHDRYQDIDANEFIPAVVDEVMAAYGADAVVQYAVEHIAVDRDHATPLALLLSELVTNTCKYAFPDGGGTIIVRLRAGENGRSVLSVRDDGVGIDLDGVTTASMGMRLIKGVVAQMDGAYTIRNDGGTVFEADIALSTQARTDG
jgi:two-component sensor histidine kinase